LSNLLVLDQSLRATGWAVVSSKQNKLLAYGCIKTMAGKRTLAHETDIANGLEILKVLEEVTNKHKITAIVFENPVGSRSARSSQALAYVKGLVIGFTITKKLKLHWVTAREAKKALTNDRDALKEEVFKKIIKEFPTFKTEASKLPKYVRHAVSDALAVYLCWSEKVKDAKKD